MFKYTLGLKQKRVSETGWDSFLLAVVNVLSNHDVAQTSSFRTSTAQLSTIIDPDHCGDILLRDLSANVGYFDTNFHLSRTTHYLL